MKKNIQIHYTQKEDIGQYSPRNVMLQQNILQQTNHSITKEEPPKTIHKGVETNSS